MFALNAGNVLTLPATAMQDMSAGMIKVTASKEKKPDVRCASIRYRCR